MSYRRVISVAAVAALGVVCVASEAWAARVGARGGAAVRGGAVGRGGAVAYRGAVGRGGAVAYRGAAVRGGAIGYRGGIYGGNYYRPGLGVAAGAVVGGAIAATQPWGWNYGGYGYDANQGYANYGYPGYPNYGYPNTGYNSGYASTSYAPGGPGGQDTAAYCAQRFKSYDPASGTYLGRDGQRRPCP
jgi:hypothetical protein